MTLDVRIDDRRGLALTPGAAALRLPSRETGPVAVLRDQVEMLRQINEG